MKERGLSSGKLWVLRSERRGKLKLPKDPRGWRKVTQREIESIVRAFSPGGKGFWSWDGSIDPTRMPYKPNKYYDEKNFGH